MSVGASAPAEPVVPIDATFFAPKDGKAGYWQVLHTDGTVLFQSESENDARGRLSHLRELARTRMSAGHAVTGSDMLALWPPTAPAALLLGALSAEQLERVDAFDPASKTWAMRNVEIFRSGDAMKRVSGEWKRLSFTTDDVKDLVEAFDALGWTPPVKVTHATEQPMVLEQLPSLARVVALRAAKVTGPRSAVGLGAFADLEKVPDALREAIRSGRLFQRSIEFWRNRIPRESGGTYPMVLKAVALLGEELPAVLGMPPIDVAPAKFGAEEPTETFTLSIETQENDPVTAPNTPGAPAKVELSAEEYAKLKQTAETASQEATRLKAEQEASAKRIAKLEADRKIESATNAAARLRAAGHITPSQEPLALEILKSLDDDSKDAVVVTLSTKDGEKTQKYSARSAFVAFCESLPKSAGAPGGARSRGDRGNLSSGDPASFDSLSGEDKSAAVAAVGNAYFEASQKAGDKAATLLSSYERARRDLVSGKAAIPQEVLS